MATVCVRVLHNSPGFAIVVVLTLALGIGANTAIFSIVDAVLLRPLPFADASRLVRIVDHARGLDLHDIRMSVPEFQDLGTRSGLFGQISAVWPVDANVTWGGQPERIEFLAVSPSYFSLLGAHAAIGRVFGPGDQAQGFGEAVVYQQWPVAWTVRRGSAYSRDSRARTSERIGPIRHGASRAISTESLLQKPLIR